MKDWEKLLKSFLKTHDFKGLAEAYEKQKISWNTENWKNFIEGIRASEKKALLKELKEVLSDCWHEDFNEGGEYYSAQDIDLWIEVQLKEMEKE